MRSAFTIVELIIVIGIILILLGIGAYALVGYRTAKQLDTITDSIVAKLEEAKTNSMSGKNGTNFGVAFTSSSYIYWSGVSYVSGSANNVEIPISANFTITSSIPGTDHAVKFAHLTGVPNVSGTTTITNISNASTTDSIVIGPLGDITVIK
ncbi:MAG: hypothetical protein RL536_260 [Candidatus Parcubacteria bacterium]|jgi:Tfp pilus assembly protein FimT